MIPPHDKITKCIPSGCHDCDIDEFKQRFVVDFPESTSRKSRFKGFIEHSKSICDNVKPIRRLMVDGSFTTKKTNPYDVDYLFVVNEHEITEAEKKFIRLEKEKNKQRKRLRNQMKDYAKIGGSIDINKVPCCDCFFLYKRKPTDKKYKDYLKDKDEWLDLFGYTRRNKKTGKKYPKGLLNLVIDSETFEGDLNDS